MAALFGYEKLSIDFLTSTPFLAWTAFVVLVGLGVYLYYRTNPPLPVYLRVILATLRLCAIAALFAALLEPVIGYERHFERKVQATVLVDISSSMNAGDGEFTRLARVESTLSNDAVKAVRSQVDIRTVYFGGNAADSRDAVQRDRTALGDVISSVGHDELSRSSDFWLLFSDGNSNDGGDPRQAASGLTVPVHAIDMAGESGQFDVGLGTVDFEPVAFVGRQSVVDIRFDWHHAVTGPLTIKLMEGRQTLKQADFMLDQEDGRGHVSLRYLPPEPGKKILTVTIETTAAEETDGNNEQSFAVKVLRSRRPVLLASWRPDHEVGFLRRHLEQSDQYDVEFIALGEKLGNLRGRFPDRLTELNRYDLIILYDPNPATLAPHESNIRSYLSERGGAVWVLMGGTFAAGNRVDWFDELLPFYPSVVPALVHADFHGEPTESELFHPSVRLADERVAIRQRWAELPPFESLVRCDQIDPQATVLLSAANSRGRGESIPLLGYRRTGPGKVLASAALPFWTWGFVGLGYGDNGADYSRFLEGTLNWLTVREDFDPIRIAPEREVVARGEPVRFAGYAFDQGYRPIPGVSGYVRLKRSDTDEPIEADLQVVSEGRFAAQLDRVPPGRYQFEARFEKGGSVLKQVDGSVMVETYSLEELDPSGDSETLSAIARLTGGQYVRWGDFDRFVEELDILPIKAIKRGEIIVWNRIWLLLIFLVALSAEWLIRKINQLI